MSEKSRRCLITMAMLSSVCALVLSGCSTTSNTAGKVASKKTGTSKTKYGGGYYQDDGPMDEIPDNLMSTPDAVPRVEKLASGPNKPYTVLGKTYVPMTSLSPYRKRGIGSWYGKKFHGQKTSSGEPYDMFKMTAAHPTLPIPSYARVTSLETGRQIIVRVNDRGPFLSGRLIDLSYTAAYKLGYVEKGSGLLEVELLLPDEIEKINLARKGVSWPAASQPVKVASSGTQKQNSAATPQKVSLGQAGAVVQQKLPSSQAGAATQQRAVSTQAGIAAQQRAASAQADMAAQQRAASAQAGIAAQQNAASAQADMAAQQRAASTQAGIAAQQNAASTQAGIAAQQRAASAQAGMAAQQRVASAQANTVAQQRVSGPAYYLQLGAYLEVNNAQHSRDKVMASWAHRLPSLEVVQIGDYYKLFAGPFNSMTEAARVAQEMKSRGTNSFIVLR